MIEKWSPGIYTPQNTIMPVQIDKIVSLGIKEMKHEVTVK